MNKETVLNFILMAVLTLFIKETEARILDNTCFSSHLTLDKVDLQYRVDVCGKSHAIRETNHVDICLTIEECEEDSMNWVCYETNNRVPCHTIFRATFLHYHHLVAVNHDSDRMKRVLIEMGLLIPMSALILLNSVWLVLNILKVKRGRDFLPIKESLVISTLNNIALYSTLIYMIFIIFR